MNKAIDDEIRRDNRRAGIAIGAAVGLLFLILILVFAVSGCAGGTGTLSYDGKTISWKLPEKEGLAK